MIVREVPKPVPARGEALVRVLSAGICGSEIHAYHGRHAKRVPPAIMGHEVCGVVEALGEGVTAPAPGTRVVVLPQKACGICHWCMHGSPNLCDAKTMLGETVWAGGFADYFAAPAELLYPIDDHVPDDVATLIEPLAVAVHAVRRAGIGLADRVVVMGAGAVGLMIMLAAREAGAGTVLATDLYDYNLERACEVGATHVVNVGVGEAVAVARELGGGLGMDAAFVAADAPGLFDQAVGSVRKQGVITLIAMFPEPRTVNLQAPKAMEHEIHGSLTFTPADFRAAVDLMQVRHERAQTCITRRFPLEQGARAFEIADTRSEDLVRIVLRP
ncbi:alcohol dehydrogenase catalytic domain-containing protein [Xanthobacteraceae bacterium Astr-EGSB]|uniref:zinc-dependent alcohol dehydrogenase n=1 Tax=Astrobacterium formosum TaxID=3069710 RepID=UPI0027B0F841|nr:alcohol dehydrogenase catalytic domain-containing protein [Xanthobacteraceae bacterium Astr-EGSB]